MTKQNKFVPNSNLNFIQLKLFDFSEEKIDHEKIISERLNKSPNIENTNQKLFLDENNIFSYVNPICPVVDLLKLSKRHNNKKQTKYQWKKLQNSKNSNINAKNVEKNSKIYNNPLIGKNKQFLQEIMDKIPEIMKIECQSLRKISKYFEIFLKIHVSPQTIKNWSNKNHKETINNEEFEYSGYYLYYEQFLRLNGVRHYRLTLFDTILNVPILERIVCRRILKNTKKFILDSTKNKPFICLTTDLFPMYSNVADEIGVNHQLCILHLF